MTTIAYRDGVMAADSASTYGNNKATQVRKVRKIGRFLVGLSGSASLAEDFCVWLARKQRITAWPVQPTGDDGVWALLVDRETGRVFKMDKCGTPFRLYGKWFATGSGMDAAMGAMAAGASALRAVEIACTIDAGSAGPVRSVVV